MTPPTLAHRCLLALLLGAAAAAAQAQFKVVGPDGKVTYTDRPPPAAEGRVVPLKGGVAVVEAAKPEAGLPFALREVANKFPVTLYATSDCGPCDRGREFLRQRGIPFRERIAATDADRAAWQRVVGSAEAPALTVGGQQLRGYSPDAWNETLDTAGYPRDSKLPASWQAPAPTPLVEPKPTAAAAPPAPPPAVAPEAPFTPASGIRF